MQVAVSFAGVCAGVLMLTSSGWSQDYPNRPLRLVTSEVGGGNDVQARIIMPPLSTMLGQQIIIDNRPSGVTPGDIVSKSTPNGYTLLLYNNALWIGPLLQPSPYDPQRDFAPITLVTKAVNLLAVNPSVPAKSVQELIALAKAKPGTLNYGSSGSGSSNHLAAELFRGLTGVNIVRVNYKGAGPALNALLAGEVQVMFPTAAAASAHLKSNRLRVLGVTSTEPSPLVPGVPTIAASGVPGYESISIYGLFAPAKTPAAIIAKLNENVVRLLNRPDMKEKLFASGLETAAGTPAQLEAMVKSEMTRMTKVIKEAGIRAE